MNSAKKAPLLPNTEGGERNGYEYYPNHFILLCIGAKAIAFTPENRQGLFHPDRPVDNHYDRPLYIRSHHRIAR